MGQTPDAPSSTSNDVPSNPFHPRVFRAEAIANGIANAADAATTQWSTNRGINEAPFPNGMSQIIGQRPGVGRYSALFVPAEIAETLAGRKLEQSQHKAARMLGHVLIDAPTVLHAAGAIHNVTHPYPKK